MAGRTREQYIALMASLNFPMPDKIQEVLQPNQSAIEDDRAKFPDLAELNKVYRGITASFVRAQAGSSATLVRGPMRVPSAGEKRWME